MKTTKTPFKLRPVATLLSLTLTGIMTILPSQVNAHGYLTSPKARQAICEEQGGYWWPADGSAIPNQACRGAFLMSGHVPFTQKPEFAALVANYNSQAAVEERVKDGQLCAGGDTSKAGMDIPSADWQRTELTADGNGQIEVTVRAETPHNPSFWQFYLTKPGFDPAISQVTWADLVMLDTVGNVPVVTGTDGHRYYQMKIDFPTDRSGDAVLFSRWQREDPAGEGFYNCSDITIKSAGTGSDPWLAAGYFVQAGIGAKADDVVRARLFSDTGTEIMNQSLLVTSDNQAHWQQALATQIQAEHGQIIQIGVKNDQGEVTFDQDNIASNQVWVHNKDYRFYLSVQSGSVNTAPKVADIADKTLVEGSIFELQAFAVDDENDSLSYRWTIPSGFTGPSTGASVSLVAPIVTADTAYTLSVAVSDGQLTTEKSFTVTVTDMAEQPWDKAKIYVAKDKVSHNGVIYQAKWWTLGEEPGKASVWLKL